MSTIRENVDELNKMILQGKILEAFDKFYADDVVMQDNKMPVREGKAECRKAEENFVNNLSEFKEAHVKNVMVSEDAGVATIEWEFDFTHKEWGHKHYIQVAVQKWVNGQITNEHFMY